MYEYKHMSSLTTNLHKSTGDLQMGNNFVDGIRAKIREISTKIPDFLGSMDVAGNPKLKTLKRNLLKKLDGKRKKFRLALESLGWGTLADLLETAFCGQQLDITV